MDYGITRTASNFAEVYIDAIQLLIIIACVTAVVGDAVLVSNLLPELAADLIPALAALNMDNLTHGALPM